MKKLGPLPIHVFIRIAPHGSIVERRANGLASCWRITDSTLFIGVPGNQLSADLPKAARWFTVRRRHGVLSLDGNGVGSVREASVGTNTFSG